MGTVHGDVDPGLDDDVLQCRRRLLSRVPRKENKPAEDHGAMWNRARGHDVDRDKLRRYVGFRLLYNRNIKNINQPCEFKKNMNM